MITSPRMMSPYQSCRCILPHCQPFAGIIGAAPSVQTDNRTDDEGTLGG
jgi:hypothetical protein